MTLHQMGREVLQTPPNLYRGSCPFHILRGRIGLHLINHSFWDACPTNPKTPQNFVAVPGPRILCGFTAHSLPIEDVPAKSAAEASLHMSTLHHQWVHFTSVWKENREQGQSSGYHPTTQCGSVPLAWWKHLKGPLLPSPHGALMTKT